MGWHANFQLTSIAFRFERCQVSDPGTAVLEPEALPTRNPGTLKP